MPQSRAEIAQRRKEEILEAALRVFSRKGFHQATNRDIADEAGIASPGLIYHYFEDKQDLLRHLLERLNPALQLLSSPGDFLELPLREGLLCFARRFLEVNQRSDLLRVILGEALRDPAMAQNLFEAGPARGLGFLSAWLARHVESGKLRPLPTTDLARQFVAPLLGATVFAVVFRREDFPADAEFIVDTFCLLYTSPSPRD